MSKSVNVDFVTRQIEVDTDGKEHFISAAMAAKDAEQSMLNAQNAANRAEKIATDLGLVDEAVQTAVSSAEQASNSATTASNKAEVASAKADVATTKASEASTSATTAAQKADAASTSATSAAQSYANANAIATQLTEYLATKETLTAPAVDKTLLIEGAAADAKVVGGLKSDLSHLSEIIFDGETILDDFDFIFKAQLDDIDGSFNVKTNVGFCSTSKYYKFPVTEPKNKIIVNKVNDPNVHVVIHFYNDDFSHAIQVRIDSDSYELFIAYPYLRVMIYNANFAELKPEIAKTYLSFNVKTKSINNFVSKKSIVRVASSSLSSDEKIGYNFICDGVNDEVEIQEAIDSLGTLGGEVALSRGAFNISSTINISTCINIHGCGGALTLDTGGYTNVKKTTLNVTDKLVDCFTIIDGDDNKQGIQIHDMQINGRGMRQIPYNAAIRVKSYLDVAKFYNLYISGMGYGICGRDDATFDGVWIFNNSIQRCGLGIHIDRGGQCRIVNNIIWDCRGIYQDTINNVPFVVECGAMFLYTVGATIIKGNTIGRPSFIDEGNNGTENNPRPVNALHLRNCQTTIISDNVISEVYANAIKITNCNYLNINNNQIDYFGSANANENDACGIQLNNCKRSKINGNYFLGLKNQKVSVVLINSQYAVKENEGSELNYITDNYITGVQKSNPIYMLGKSVALNNCFENDGIIQII